MTFKRYFFHSDKYYILFWNAQNWLPRLIYIWHLNDKTCFFRTCVKTYIQWIWCSLPLILQVSTVPSSNKKAFLRRVSNLKGAKLYRQHLPQSTDCAVLTRASQQQPFRVLMSVKFSADCPAKFSQLQQQRITNRECTTTTQHLLVGWLSATS